MTNDDRKIDRKANDPTVEGDPVEPDPDRKTDGGQDLRPDLSHFDNFDVPPIRRHLPHVDLPSVPVTGVAMVVLYASVVVGALSVAYGATSLASTHGGFYAALIVGGVFAFVYGYVGLQAVATVTTDGEPRR